MAGLGFELTLTYCCGLPLRRPTFCGWLAADLGIGRRKKEKKNRMLPQKPAHVSQELWELELPSILGLAHPRASVGDTDSEDLSPTGAATFTQPASAQASTSARMGTLTAASSSSLPSCNPVEYILDPNAASSKPIFAVDSDTDMEDSGAQSELATQVYEEPDVPGGDWSEVWNMDRPAQGFITYELRLDGMILPPAPEHDAPVMEWLAYFVCSRRSCTTDDLRHLCQQLPLHTSAKRRKLTTSDGDTGRPQRSFSVGAYSAGGCHGIQRNTLNFPWTSCWLTSLVREAAPLHQFSTCTLLHNVMHFKHTDSRNAPNTQNVIIPCDFWRGGQLWVADPCGSIHLDSTSGPGILREITRPCVVLNPTTPRATFPWSHGDRTILVAHHARGLAALTHDQRDTLARFGFQLFLHTDAAASSRHYCISWASTRSLLPCTGDGIWRGLGCYLTYCKR